MTLFFFFFTLILTWRQKTDLMSLTQHWTFLKPGLGGFFLFCFFVRIIFFATGWWSGSRDQAQAWEEREEEKEAWEEKTGSSVHSWGRRRSGWSQEGQIWERRWDTSKCFVSTVHSKRMTRLEAGSLLGTVSAKAMPEKSCSEPLTGSSQWVWSLKWAGQSF